MEKAESLLQNGGRPENCGKFSSPIPSVCYFVSARLTAAPWYILWWKLEYGKWIHFHNFSAIFGADTHFWISFRLFSQRSSELINSVRRKLMHGQFITNECGKFQFFTGSGVLLTGKTLYSMAFSWQWNFTLTFAPPVKIKLSYYQNFQGESTRFGEKIARCVFKMTFNHLH